LEQNVGIIAANLPPMRPLGKMAGDKTRQYLSLLRTSMPSTGRQGTSHQGKNSTNHPTKRSGFEQLDTTDDLHLPLQQFSQHTKTSRTSQTSFV